jgi:hypothetical protein
MKEFSLEEVIEMAKDYASEQFTEVLNDHGKELEFFKNYSYTITVTEVSNV